MFQVVLILSAFIIPMVICIATYTVTFFFDISVSQGGHNGRSDEEPVDLRPVGAEERRTRIAAAMAGGAVLLEAGDAPAPAGRVHQLLRVPSEAEGASTLGLHACADAGREVAPGGHHPGTRVGQGNDAEAER